MPARTLLYVFLQIRLPHAVSSPERSYAVFLLSGRWRGASSTLPWINFSVKSREQEVQSQKCSIPLFCWLWKPKNLPPSRRISNLEQTGLAHLETMISNGF